MISGTVDSPPASDGNRINELRHHDSHSRMRAHHTGSPAATPGNGCLLSGLQSRPEGASNGFMRNTQDHFLECMSDDHDYNPPPGGHGASRKELKAYPHDVSHIYPYGAVYDTSKHDYGAKLNAFAFPHSKEGDGSGSGISTYQAPMLEILPPKKLSSTFTKFCTPVLISLSYTLAEWLLFQLNDNSPLASDLADPLQQQIDLPRRSSTTTANFLLACTLVGVAMTLAGLFWEIQYLQHRADTGGEIGEQEKIMSKYRVRVSITTIAEYGLSTLLPYFAALELGGTRAALFTLITLSGELSGAFKGTGGWRKLLTARKGTTLLIFAWVAWEACFAGNELHAIMLGYMTLLASAVLLPSPFSRNSFPLQEPSYQAQLSLITGPILCAFPMFRWLLFHGVAARPPLQLELNFVCAAFGICACLVFCSLSQQTNEFGGSIYFLAGAFAAIALHWPTAIANSSMPIWQLLEEVVLVGLALVASRLDFREHGGHCHSHSHSHEGHTHSGRGHLPANTKAPSAQTLALLRLTEGVPLLHSIIAERDSRRIFYFMLLNFAFMIVQTCYGFWTGSLGLLSDSIHMLFDCLALAVGLCAAVMSKWPPNQTFPYGLGKMDTLAGFANGILLMLISVEIVLEAIERLVNPTEMSRLGELLIVSAAGLVVNVIGIMAFDHAHHGHGHGHGHSHSHSHLHGHDHSDNFQAQLGHSHSHDEGTFLNHECNGDNNRHNHGNENMYGIYLHVMADTLGSAAVVASTLLVQYFNWPGFDPIASVLIAVLIFASAVPLVLSSASTLLLTVPANTEYTLREKLAGIGIITGVAGYCAPRFWTDQNAEGKERILGVIHVQAVKGADIKEIRERVESFLGENVEAIVQVERINDGANCWCGGASPGGLDKRL